MSFYVRFDEDQKSPEQRYQRERTYEAAKALRQLGFDCSVQEFFTGDNKLSDTAAIIIRLGPTK